MKHLALLLCASCGFISFDEVEMQQPSSCDLAHPCVTGYHCNVLGKCSLDQCMTGSAGLSCSKQVGVCMGSHLQCVGGMFEISCSDATYGADYESGSETRCDNKDNDCDGQTDESLTQLCPLQNGVCAGAQVSCTNGAYPMCSAAVYSARSTSYETFESSCDVFDNDCDGKADAWAPQNLSNSPGIVSHNATAAATGGSVIALWEEGNKVMGRVAHLDGTLSSMVAPSTTADVAVRAFAPAVAADGNLVVAAWGEEVSGGTSRAMLTALDPATARSALSGANALLIYNRGPQEIAIAASSVDSRIMIALTDNNTLAIIEYPAVLSPTPAPTFTNLTFATNARHPSVTASGSSHFWVTWEEITTGTVQRCLVDAIGQKNCAPMPPVAHNPGIFVIHDDLPQVANLYMLIDNDAGTQSLGVSTCTDGGTCTPTTVLIAPPPQSVLNARAVAPTRMAPPNVFAWEDANANLRYFSTLQMQVLPVGPNPGRRPTPVLTGSFRGGVVFDTEGSTSGSIAADDVFFTRYCF
jgi:hypothetical protein